MKTILMNANVLLAHATPRFLYIAVAAWDRCQSLESQQPEVWNALTKKREGGAESAPHEVVSSHDRCSIFGISIWKIIENTVEQ